jgi:hypothetical protein
MAEGRDLRGVGRCARLASTRGLWSAQKETPAHGSGVLYRDSRYVVSPSAHAPLQGIGSWSTGGRWCAPPRAAVNLGEQLVGFVEQGVGAHGLVAIGHLDLVGFHDRAPPVVGGLDEPSQQQLHLDRGEPAQSSVTSGSVSPSTPPVRVVVRDWSRLLLAARPCGLGGPVSGGWGRGGVGGVPASGLAQDDQHRGELLGLGAGQRGELVVSFPARFGYRTARRVASPKKCRSPFPPCRISSDSATKVNPGGRAWKHPGPGLSLSSPLSADTHSSLYEVEVFSPIVSQYHQIGDTSPPGE